MGYRSKVGGLGDKMCFKAVSEIEINQIESIPI